MNEEIISLVRNYIQANYAQINSLMEIALEINCNYNSLRHDYTFFSGETLGVFLNKIRCKKAAQLLIKTDWKLYKVAKEVGFHDDKHFIKVFEKFYGMTPSAFRNRKHQ